MPGSPEAPAAEGQLAALGPDAPESEEGLLYMPDNIGDAELEAQDPAIMDVAGSRPPKPELVTTYLSEVSVSSTTTDFLFLAFLVLALAAVFGAHLLRPCFKRLGCCAISGVSDVHSPLLECKCNLHWTGSTVGMHATTLH